MKAAFRVLLIVCWALMQHGYASNPVAAQSAANPTTSNHSNGADYIAPPGQSKTQQGVTASGGSVHSRHVTSKIRTQSRANEIKGKRSKTFRSKNEPLASRNAMQVHQPSSTKPAGVGRIAKHHTLPIRPVTGSAISGGQFKNARRPNSTLAVVGGPKSARGTAAITGTSAERKPLN